MKWLSILALALPATVYAAMPMGIDVSSHQPSINWNTVKANGIEFAYIKATEGTGQYLNNFCFALAGSLIAARLHL